MRTFIICLLRAAGLAQHLPGLAGMAAGRDVSRPSVSADVLPYPREIIAPLVHGAREGRLAVDPLAGRFNLAFLAGQFLDEFHECHDLGLSLIAELTNLFLIRGNPPRRPCLFHPSRLLRGRPEYMANEISILFRLSVGEQYILRDR